MLDLIGSATELEAKGNPIASKRLRQVQVLDESEASVMHRSKTHHRHTLPTIDVDTRHLRTTPTDDVSCRCRFARTAEGGGGANVAPVVQEPLGVKQNLWLATEGAHPWEGAIWCESLFLSLSLSLSLSLIISTIYICYGSRLQRFALLRIHAICM